MDITIGIPLEQLRVLFTKMKNVYYIAVPDIPIEDIVSVDIELPILDKGIHFDSGAPTVKTITLTEGRNWISTARSGVPTITFQVASVADAINSLMLSPSEDESSVTMTATVNGVTYSGSGYSLTPRKIRGALFMTSEDLQSALYLPSIEGYAHLVATDGTNPAFYDVKITPMEDPRGAAIYILNNE
ncbi:MAG: hypothetical protein J6Z41_00110 [Prevotella sp.]|nr:hypothetical protein [Prevotella sp.]